MITKTNAAKAKKKAPAKRAAADLGRIETFANAWNGLASWISWFPFPRDFGSRVRIWKQDPSVEGLGTRTAYIHTRIRRGPSDSQIVIAGMPIVEPASNGDFLFDPSEDEAFDSVHTYSVVRQTLTYYQRVLGRLMKWEWNTGTNQTPIEVMPRAGVGANAYYTRTGKALRFLYFRPTPTADYVYTCRSLDIVSHECGHAILDSLKPDWILWGQPPQTGGLHESFGDLTAIFLALSQLDQVEYLIAETRANLHAKKNVLARLAEEFGEALGRPSGLRNADNDLKLSEVTNEVHDLSQVFTGAVYDVLADLFTAMRNPRRRDDAEVLYEAAKIVARVVIEGIEKSPPSGATFAHVAKAMKAVASANGDSRLVNSIQRQFERREVIGPNAVTLDEVPAGLGVDRSGCCGTMRNVEYDESED